MCLPHREHLLDLSIAILLLYFRLNIKPYGSLVVHPRNLKIVNSDNLASGVLAPKVLDLLNELIASVRCVGNVGAVTDFSVEDSATHTNQIEVLRFEVNAILLADEFLQLLELLARLTELDERARNFNRW